MKPTLLLTALLCGSAQASLITVDIYQPGPNSGPYGSYQVEASPFSPELSFGSPGNDWHPFGLLDFFADIHGSFTVSTPGTGLFSLSVASISAPSGANLTIFGIDELSTDPPSPINEMPQAHNITIDTPGSYAWELRYTPEMRETLTDDGRDVRLLPTGKSYVAVKDWDHPWGSVGVPDSDGWLLWLVPAGILLLRRKQ